MKFVENAVVLLVAFASSASAFAPTPAATVHSCSTAHQATKLEPDITFLGSEFVNEAELFENSSFPIPPEKLKERVKEVLSRDVALGQKDGGECLADNFVFCAAVVGPIGKKEYLSALGTFKLEDGFDIGSNNFGMTVDPLQPNRVWLLNRVKAIHTGTFMGAKPTGKEIIYPPQIQHLDFNEEGKLVEYGFYTADRRQGNTGGLGGAFGFMYGVGKPLPIPECQPFKPSNRFRLLQLVGGLARRFSKKNEEDE
jgi:hypothetical protein